jgi:hypothetical protein
VKGSTRLKGSSSDEDEEHNSDIKRAEEKPASSGQSTPVVEKSAEELERKQGKWRYDLWCRLLSLLITCPLYQNAISDGKKRPN